MVQTTPVDSKTVEALLKRGRIRMVQALIHEGGLADPQQMHTYWRGFAHCAKALLDGSGAVMASHDEASDTQAAVQAAFARLPNDVERLTLADMKRHMRAQGVDFALDPITGRNVNAVVQLQDGVRPAIKQDDEHAVAAVDVGDGGGVHGQSPIVAGVDIVKDGATVSGAYSPNLTCRELCMLDVLARIVIETMAYPPMPLVDSESYLPDTYINAAQGALDLYGRRVRPVGAPL